MYSFPGFFDRIANTRETIEHLVLAYIRTGDVSHRKEKIGLVLLPLSTRKQTDIAF
jgi:hypothetical protein